MTNEEAIKYLECGAVADCLCPSNKKHGGKCDGEDRVNEAIEMAIKALENADQFRWHDLTKNPEDLPGDYHSVLICLRGFEGNKAGVSMAMHNRFNNIWGSEIVTYKDYEVIAWREIDPFEEVKE